MKWDLNGIFLTCIQLEFPSPPQLSLLFAIRYCLLPWQLCCFGLRFKWRSNFSSDCDGRMHKARHFNSHISLGKFSCHAWVNTVNCQLFRSAKPASDLHLIFLLLWRMWPVQISSSPSISGRLGNSPNSLLRLRLEVSLHLYLVETKLEFT